LGSALGLGLGLGSGLGSGLLQEGIGKAGGVAAAGCAALGCRLVCPPHPTPIGRYFCPPLAKGDDCGPSKEEGDDRAEGKVGEFDTLHALLPPCLYPYLWTADGKAWCDVMATATAAGANADAGPAHPKQSARIPPDRNAWVVCDEIIRS